MNNRRTKFIKKDCYFCVEKKEPDFLENEMLGKFLSERRRIMSRDRSGLCSKHQRKFMKEVKRARFLALLPFIVRPE